MISTLSYSESGCHAINWCAVGLNQYRYWTSMNWLMKCVRLNKSSPIFPVLPCFHSLFYHAGSQPPLTCGSMAHEAGFRCRKCRLALFTSANIVSSHGEPWTGHVSFICPLSKADTVWYVREQDLPEWMLDQINCVSNLNFIHEGGSAELQKAVWGVRCERNECWPVTSFTSSALLWFFLSHQLPSVFEGPSFWRFNIIHGGREICHGANSISINQM